MRTPRKLLGCLLAVTSAFMGISAFAGSATWDFSTDPSLDPNMLIQGNNPTPWLSTGGNPASGGFLALTYSTDGQNAGITFPDFDSGKVVTAFKFECDLRIGNPTGTRAADGFSISLVRGGDPLIENPGTYGNFAGGVPEAGGTTGLAISFDTWSGNTLPDGADIEGIIVRIDNKTILRKGLPVRNGECNEINSLQTGPRDAAYWAAGGDAYAPEAWAGLCWQPFSAELDAAGKLTVIWKGEKILDQYQTTYFPSKARLVFAARTGDENENTHIDNIKLTTVVSDDQSPPSVPANLRARFTGSHIVGLEWDAATDDSGRVVYEIDRDGTTVATLLEPVTYSDSSVAPNTSYTYKVRALDAAGNKSAFSAPLTVKTGVDVEGVGYATFQYWKTSPDGTAVEILTTFADYPNKPHLVSYTPQLDSRPVFPDDTHEQYGGKILGWLTPAESGNYTFFVSSDDASEFWLSTDANAANLVKVCEETDCCEGFLEPGTPNDDGVTFTTSEPVALVAGKKYYFELLWKEGGGGDYGRVAWRKAGDTTPAGSLPAIPGAFLSTQADPGGASVTITQQPQSVTVPESSLVTFTLAETHTSPYVTSASIQWYRNNQPIIGATGSSYTTGFLTPADNGAKYKAMVAVPGASTFTDEATVTVTSDTTPPTLMYATGTSSFTGVQLWFSEPLDPVTAQQVANYQISGGVTVTSATLSTSGTTANRVVNLVTSAQTPGTNYTVTVSGVKDASSAGNLIAAGASLQFSAWTLATGYLRFEHYDNLSGAGDPDIDTALADPRVVAGTPTTQGYLSGRFDTRTIFPDDTHENYLGRITGWITPTESGDYHFFLRSDDASRLYLSTTEAIPNPSVDTPICNEPGCCNAFYEPDAGDPATTTGPITLQAGKRYGVLALLKEAGGGDYLMVAWRKTTDTTAAASLPYLPGQYLSTYVDPNVDLIFVQQPTDQVGVLPSTGVVIASEDFNGNNGGFTVTNTSPVAGEEWTAPGPFAYDSAAGKWVARGKEDACTDPCNSQLTSPVYTMAQDGAVTLSFAHRYSFEPDLYDGAMVRISVNGGPFRAVPAESFTENGYASGNIVGNGILNGQRAFNADSPGYAAGEFITSKASLGNFAKNDKLLVQFVGGWDECTVGKYPNWEIDSVKLELLPMIIQDFSKSDGGFTVQNSPAAFPAARGPWTYNGTNAWAANGSDASCGDPVNSKLTSPAYVIPQADEVTLNFTHRYSFEGDGYDGGQVWISVNGGAFTAVPAENFTANGYAAVTIQGNGILNGQRAFNGDSTGFASGAYITSSALLGTFNQNDTIVVQFVGAWDECSGGTGQPSWAIKSLQLVIGTAAKDVTFEAQVQALRQGTPEPVKYQWQRNDGAAWVDIANATSATYRIFPVAADFEADYRLVASVPGKSIVSDVVNIVTGVEPAPTIEIAAATGAVTITFTGKLQSSAQVDGAYQDVAGATSPYVVTNPTGVMFYRSVK